MLAITHERMSFIGQRQAYYLSALRAKRVTSRTVLFQNLPKEHQSVEALRNLLGHTVRRVWMASDCQDLQDAVDDLTKSQMKLEGAEAGLVKNANTKRLKSQTEKGEKPSAESGDSEAQTWLKNEKRPTHKLKMLIGKKVDTLDYCRDYIPKQYEEVAKQQREHLDDKHVVGAAFVEFDSQYSAQRAFQMALPAKKNYKPRYIDVQPGEIIWKNLGKSYASKKMMMALATVAMTLLVIFWTPITGFVGILTNISYITNKVPFLSFINSIPGPILGVVTGLLPTLILALCVILVPIICRLLAKMAGAATLSEVELKTQNWYFVFQVIQVFLVTTFVSGASSVVTQIINNPTTAPTLLAKNLPKASNFYISYLVIYGLGQAAMQLLLIVPLLMKTILGKYLDKTPRKRYNRWTALAGPGWGSDYPKWTNLGVIALSYSCIAPLILGFATIGFTLLYIAFRHQWLFVYGNKVDMKGESYSRALQQLTTGVYLSAFCLIGLFAIATASSTMAVGPLVLMIIFFIAMVVFNVITDRALGPLEQTLPLDMLRENEASMWRAPNKSEEQYDQHTGDQHMGGQRGNGQYAGGQRMGGQQTNGQHGNAQYAGDQRMEGQYGNEQYDNGPKTQHYIIGNDDRNDTPVHNLTTQGGPEYGQTGQHDQARNQYTNSSASEHDAEKSMSRDHEKGNDPEYEGEAKDNMLTRRARPIIHKRFFLPASHQNSVTYSAAQLESDMMDDEKIAFINPCITQEEPLIWVVKDEAGVGKILIRGNEEKGVKSTDDYAWLDIQEKKGKRKVAGVMWDTARAEAVGDMLDRRSGGENTQNTDQQNTGTVTS